MRSRFSVAFVLSRLRPSWTAPVSPVSRTVCTRRTRPSTRRSLLVLDARPAATDRSVAVTGIPTSSSLVLTTSPLGRMSCTRPAASPGSGGRGASRAEGRSLSRSLTRTTSRACVESASSTWPRSSARMAM